MLCQSPSYFDVDTYKSFTPSKPEGLLFSIQCLMFPMASPPVRSSQRLRSVPVYSFPAHARLLFVPNYNIYQNLDILSTHSTSQKFLNFFLSAFLYIQYTIIILPFSFSTFCFYNLYKKYSSFSTKSKGRIFFIQYHIT